MDPRSLLLHLESPYRAYDPSLGTPREVILAGLTCPSEYWVDLAITWLEQGAPIDQEVAAHLDAIAGNKQFSQNVRHRAFALAQRWQRNRQGD
jgi:hypothetical protein